MTTTDKKIKNGLWVEKYRPPSVSKILLPKSFAKYFGDIASGKSELKNILLYSTTPGSGKTSTAKALCRDLGIEPLYLNISAESGIDVLRTTIQKFASSYSIKGKDHLKVVIMDEADGASINLQRGLRACIEEYSNLCRFIITANYVEKIIPALRSRCQEFDFNMYRDDIRNEMIPLIEKRVFGVLKHEGVEYEEEAVKSIVDDFYPDIRKTLQYLQQASAMMGRIDKDSNIVEHTYTGLWEHLMRFEYRNARTYVATHGIDPNSIYRPMFDELVPLIDDGYKSHVILTIDEYMDKATRTFDPEIVMSACFIAIIRILSGVEGD